MQFVRFESQGGNSKVYAIFTDECDKRYEMDHEALAHWISSKRCVSPGLDVSTETGVLAKLPKWRQRNRGGHPPLDPDNILVKNCNFRLSEAMYKAIDRQRAGRPFGFVLRELIALGLEHKK